MAPRLPVSALCRPAVPVLGGVLSARWLSRSDRSTTPSSHSNRTSGVGRSPRGSDRPQQRQSRNGVPSPSVPLDDDEQAEVEELEASVLASIEDSPRRWLLEEYRGVWAEETAGPIVFEAVVEVRCCLMSPTLHPCVVWVACCLDLPCRLYGCASRRDENGMCLSDCVFCRVGQR